MIDLLIGLINSAYLIKSLSSLIQNKHASCILYKIITNMQEWDYVLAHIIWIKRVHITNCVSKVFDLFYISIGFPIISLNHRCKYG